MSDDLTKTLPKLRTFAKDIERARAKSGEPLPAEVTIPTLKTSAKSNVKEEKIESDTATSAHIPAFHELQKKGGVGAKHSSPTEKQGPKIEKGPNITATPSTAPSPKKIQVRGKKAIAPSKVSGGGTIITDTKKGDFKFLPSLLASMDRSIASFAKLFKRKSRPTYTVAATDRRKGVIQKATSKTGTIFTADNETLKEEIRRRQMRSQHKTDPSDGTTEVLWSPNTEPGFALLKEGAVVQPRNISLEFKKRAIPDVPPMPVAAPVPQPAPTPQPVVPPPPVPVIPPPMPEIVPEPTPTQPPVSEEEPAATAATATPEPIDPGEYLENETYTEPSELDEAPVESPSLDWRSIRNIGDVSKLRTNTLAIGLLSVIFVFITIIVAARAVVTVFTPNEPAPSPIIATNPLTTLPVVEITIAEPTPDALIGALRSYQGPHTPAELALVDVNGSSVPARDVLALMTLRVDPNFTQSVSTVRVAHFGTSRALVLEITDATAVLGSLLKWEPTMTADLSDVLGLTLISSDEKFVDQTYRTIDVRILRSQEAPVLVYGFIATNTVVIAPDIETFSALLGETE